MLYNSCLWALWRECISDVLMGSDLVHKLACVLLRDKDWFPKLINKHQNLTKIMHL